MPTATDATSPSPHCSLAEVRYAPGCVQPMHTHDAPAISLVLAGGVRERDERGREHTASACWVVLKPAGSRHADEFGPRGARMFSMKLANGVADAMHERLAPGSPPKWLDSTPAARALLGAHAALRAADPAAARIGEERALALLGMIAGDAPPPAGAPAWLARVRGRLDDAPDEPVRVRDLAADAGVHPVHLARVFRQACGCGVIDYQRRRRVARAARRIADSRDGLARIAAASGFADQSHMGREMRRELGVTPGSLRSLLRA